LALIANQIINVFGIPVATVMIVKLNPLEFDLSARIVLILEPGLDICTGVDKRNCRWFCDRVGLDVGFEFRKRECKRAKDERSRDCERNSSHCFAPYCEPERGQDRNLSPRRLKISASRAFGWIDVIAEQRRSAFPSTSTGERRENMSQVL
jgi:hypothetical protein